MLILAVYLLKEQQQQQSFWQPYLQLITGYNLILNNQDEFSGCDFELEIEVEIYKQ